MAKQLRGMATARMAQLLSLESSVPVTSGCRFMAGIVEEEGGVLWPVEIPVISNWRRKADQCHGFALLLDVQGGFMGLTVWG